MSRDRDITTRAWVVLVMLRDEYACGAAVVAQSLRQVGTKYPIWCAYADITPEAVAMLASHFDRVVEVPIIEQTCVPLKSAKQNIIYGSWIEKSFTKWNIMNPELFPLERVVLLDADVNVLSSIDDIFDLSAPAATFSSPWVGPYVDGRRDARTAINHGNPYCDIIDGVPVDLDHGAVVEKWRLEVGLKCAIGPIANMVLVEPSVKSHEIMLGRLRERPRFGSSACQSGHDEQLLARVWLDMNVPPTNIHQEYNWYVGKTSWLRPGQVPKTHQFYNGKPWRDITSSADRDRIKYDDVNAWWTVADSLMLENPEWKAWFYRGWSQMQGHHPSSMLKDDRWRDAGPRRARAPRGQKRGGGSRR